MAQTETKKPKTAKPPVNDDSQQNPIAGLAQEFIEDSQPQPAEQTLEADLSKTDPQQPPVDSKAAPDQQDQNQTGEEKMTPPAHTGKALKAYGSHTKKAREDKLIIEFLPMVHKIVSQVVTYLQPPLTMDDLVSAGTIGLVKAARDYDKTKEAEFKTYAYIRIKGAVIDELRGWSFAPASLKKMLQNARDTYDAILSETNREPTDEQIADRMGIPVEKLLKVYENARARHFLSLDTITGNEENATSIGQTLEARNTRAPSARMETRETAKALAQAIQQLPEKLRQIILLYYHKELTMKEVAEVLNITESRVSQLHASAVFKLSNKIRNWHDT